MAYSNFVPTVWNESIMRDLERKCVFVEDCIRKYEGDVKEKGDQVRIPGIGKPTIRSIEINSGRTNTNGDIAAAEEVADTSVTLKVDQIRYFNYMVGDVDKAQAIGGVMDALSAETSEGLANETDKFISALIADENVTKMYNTAETVTAANVLGILDAAIQKLYENDVNPMSDIVVTVSPRFFTLFKQAYISADTNNSAMIKNGKVAMYGNVTVKMSNNVYKTQTTAAGDTDNIMIRTKRAIAFVQPKTHTEAYRPDNKFADAVKGFILFGGKVVRPKEILNINVKYAS